MHNAEPKDISEKNMYFFYLVLFPGFFMERCASSPLNYTTREEPPYQNLISLQQEFSPLSREEETVYAELDFSDKAPVSDDWEKTEPPYENRPYQFLKKKKYYALVRFSRFYYPEPRRFLNYFSTQSPEETKDLPDISPPNSPSFKDTLPRLPVPFPPEECLDSSEEEPIYEEINFLSPKPQQFKKFKRRALWHFPSLRKLTLTFKKPFARCISSPF